MRRERSRIADGVARKREGANCGVSHSTLHKEYWSGAHGLHDIPGVKPLMHLGKLTEHCSVKGQAHKQKKTDPVVQAEKL